MARQIKENDLREVMRILKRPENAKKSMTALYEIADSIIQNKAAEFNPLYPNRASYWFDEVEENEKAPIIWSQEEADEDYK